MTSGIHSHKPWQVTLERGTPSSRGAQLQSSPCPHHSSRVVFLHPSKSSEEPRAGETTTPLIQFHDEAGRKESV